MALRTPTSEAEKIKLNMGYVSKVWLKLMKILMFRIGDRPNRTLSRASLAQIIEPRIEELLFPDRRDCEGQWF